MSELTQQRATVRREGGGSVLDSLCTGQWYWLSGTNHDGEKWRGLFCVTHIGSNYAEMQRPYEQGGYSHERVHFDEFSDRCEFEPDSDSIIKGYVARHRQESHRLMQEVQELTTRLAIAQRPGLQADNEVGSMALSLHSGQPAAAYKAELTRAKKETLPELFKKIESEMSAMSQWMKASLLPMRAQLSDMKPAIEAIEKRIFNVELYAGLSEEVEEIRSGAPAAIGEQIRLFQRRHYMDEECLAQYEAGGMEYKDIAAFDAWLLRPDNLQRILPFQRCVVAFRVRRNDKDRGDLDLGPFVSFALKNADATTFLYIRNGEQVHRLTTTIDFRHKLFPDLDRSVLDGVVYAKYFSGVDKKLIGQGEFEALLKDYVGKDMSGFESRKSTKAEREERLARARAEDAAGKPVRLNFYSYVRWTPASVFYDDITRVVQDQIEHHNRVVTVLQGLLDRSPVLHPHPRWQLWNAAGFAAAVVLVHDESRAITSGDKPDFEAYRARLAAKITVGTHTVGQEDYWQRQEAKKENERIYSHGRGGGNFRPYERFTPYSDPGPGLIAPVAALEKRGASFRWTKAREGRTRWGGPTGDVERSVRVPMSELFNVDDYVPGDFRQFYADPRTRAEYLRWAPFLLRAEDWHAGTDGLKTSSRRRQR